MSQIPPSTHHGLAHLMSHNPDIATFRRFAALNNLNLLYLQAELARLEADLEHAMREDLADADPERRRAAWDYDALRREGEKGEGDAGEGSSVWDIVEEIRGKVREYNKALIHQTHLTSHPCPHSLKLQALQDFLHAKPDGACQLRGLDALTWNSSDRSELLVLDPGHLENPLSRWVHRKVVGWWIRIFDRRRRRGADWDPETNSWLAEYDERPFSLLAAVLNSLMSVLILISSIVVLYFVRDMLARVLIVAGFTAVFSLSVTLLLQARKVKVFAATAAFAAVLVVFVANTTVSVPMPMQ